MDTVFIRELRIDAEIGVYEWEHNMKQPITLDIEVATDIRKAAETDDIEHTVDYKLMVDRITELVTSKHFKLVETIAENLAGVIQKEFGVTWVKLRIAKLEAIKTARDVGVVIERGSRT